MHTYLQALPLLNAIYPQADEVAATRAQAHQATCQKGCNHCCYLLATPTLPEMLAVANVLTQKPDWVGLMPSLRQSALDACYPSITRPNFFEKQLPCVLLKDGLCSVYEVRPSCCRYHLVASPPANCELGAEVKDVAIINCFDIESAIWEAGRELLGLSQMELLRTSGPLPILLAYSIILVLEARQSFKAARQARAYFADVPTPPEWFKLYGHSLLGDGASLLKARAVSPEDLERMRHPR